MSNAAERSRRTKADTSCLSTNSSRSLSLWLCPGSFGWMKFAYMHWSDKCWEWTDVCAFVNRSSGVIFCRKSYPSLSWVQVFKIMAPSIISHWNKMGSILNVAVIFLLCLQGKNYQEVRSLIPPEAGRATSLKKYQNRGRAVGSFEQSTAK